MLELYALLDGWDVEHPPDQIPIDPRRILGPVGIALEHGQAKKALDLLENEINRLRHALRAYFFYESQLDHSFHSGADEFDLRGFVAHLHILASEVYIDRCEFSKARFHLLNALIVTPKNLKAKIHLVEVHFHSNNTSMGLAQLDQLIGSDVDGIAQVYNLALDMKRQKMFDIAEKCLVYVETKDPLGILQKLVSIHRDTFQCNSHTVPEIEEINDSLMHVSHLLKNGNIDEALQHCLKTISNYPVHSRSWFVVGYIYQNEISGDMQTKQLNNRLIYSPRVQSGERHEELRKACFAYNQSILYEPGFVDAHHQLANCYMVLQEYAKALESMQNALRISPNNIDLVADYSQILLLNQKFELARKYASQVIAINPRNVVASLVLNNLHAAEI